MTRRFRLDWQSRRMRRKGFVYATVHFGAQSRLEYKNDNHKAVFDPSALAKGKFHPLNHPTLPSAWREKGLFT
jgi:hypothetical protein